VVCAVTSVWWSMSIIIYTYNICGRLGVSAIVRDYRSYIYIFINKIKYVFSRSRFLSRAIILYCIYSSYTYYHNEIFPTHGYYYSRTFIYSTADNNIILRRMQLRATEGRVLEVSRFLPRLACCYFFFFILSRKYWIVLLRFIVKIIIIPTPGVVVRTRAYLLFLPRKNNERNKQTIGPTRQSVRSIRTTHGFAGS